MASLPLKPSRRASLQLPLQRGAIAKVGMHAIDRLYAERRGREQAGAARELEGEGKCTTRIAFARGAERGA